MWSVRAGWLLSSMLSPLFSRSGPLTTLGAPLFQPVPLILMGYLLIACSFIRLPGLQYDEVLFTNAALGNVDNSFIAYEVEVGDYRIPLMLMPYIGALKSLLYAPLLKFLPPSPVTVRLPVVLLGLLSLLLTYRLVGLLFDRSIAIWALVLLASDPSYIFQIRVDWGPVALMMLLKISSLLCFTQFVLTQRTHYLAAGALLMGLGVYDKVNYAWYVAALLPAALLVWGKSVLRKTTLRRVGIALFFFVLGCWPVLLYNVATRGQTFEGRLLTESLTKSVNVRAGLLIETLNGTGAYRYFNGEPPGHWTKAFSWAGFPKTLTPWILVTLPFLLFGHGSRSNKDRQAFHFVVLLASFILLEILVTHQALGWHHFMLLFPFTQIIIAYGLARLLQPADTGTRQLRHTAHWVAACLLISLVGTNLLMDVKYLRSLSRDGGRGIFSHAIYELAEYANENPENTYLLMDWGFSTQLLLLSRGAIKKEEIFWSLLGTPDEGALADNLHRRFQEPATRFVFRASGQEVFKQPKRFFEILLGRHGLAAETVKTFYQRDGQPIYFIQRLAQAPTRVATQEDPRVASFVRYQNSLGAIQ
jgi:4-amino-4-deoxy-L-arabinose transferase-like glycosyltransferase